MQQLSDILRIIVKYDTNNATFVFYLDKNTPFIVFKQRIAEQAQRKFGRPIMANHIEVHSLM
jgi:hypothetical protein